MHPLLRLTVPLAVFLLAACGPSNTNPDGGTDGAVAATCTDGEHNGTETDIDCGGGCGPCELAKQCAAGTDCQSGVCEGGVCVECSVASECPGEDGTCATRTCTNGTCGFQFAAAGTALPDQVAGDCRRAVCDGAGAATTEADDSDLPDDMNACTTGVCTDGVVSHEPLAAGEACSENDGTMCDGAGACVQCVQASDCAGEDTACSMRTCTAGVCGVSFTPEGTAVPEQVAGDCQEVVCDGEGGTASRALNTDLPDDNLACTEDLCVAGVPSHEPLAAGEACAENGGVMCDGAGACVACVAASDCPGSDTECSARTCNAGVCGVAFTSAGTAVAQQTAGDCQQNVCDGVGGIISQALNTDLPNDGIECTSDVCVNGVPSHPALTAGATCSQNGGAMCDGAGACVACLAASDCPGSDTECSARTCNAGVCGVAFTAAGTAVAQQTAGDCQQNVCDGAGQIISQALNTDLPNDGIECTSDVCVNGVPSHPARTSGASCSQNGGAVCDGAGACVQCVAATDCPGSDTECSARTCNAGVCGVAHTAAGTAVAQQTAGDCQQNVCDGNGQITSQALNSDLPADDGNQCTSAACVNGVPSHPAVTSGSTCSQNGGSMCDGAGACVSCLAASDCPGSDTECSARTCNAGVCGVAFTAAGTSVAQQTAGDCQQNVCDGNGQIISQALNSDLPADDGNQCTSAACVNGVPSHPAVTSGSTCSQNGGSMCDGAGACVSCLAASDCPGSDTECSARTCNAGVCGVSHVVAGTAVAQQTTGDCQQDVCDGSGQIVSQALNTDLPADDGNQCTSATCVDGAPVHANVSQGQTCSQNGGAMCDGAGACVSCLAASDCPGSDTECSTRTCNAGVCGVAHTAAGTAVAQQTTGDCQQNVCDGTGGIISQALNTDLPADDGNQCTTAICADGAPSHPAVGAGATCSQNGGSMCDGQGACVSCLAASDCPGSDTECSTRTCNAGVCGVAHTAAGTAVAQQTTGDCQQNVCDGSGQIVSQALNTDLPADDGNQCTTAICADGAPVHANLSQGQSCSQNGGSICDGAGACVGCVAATDCPGSDTECGQRTCNAGVCGMTFTQAGTAVAQQTAGDCQQNVCDGNGQVVSQAFDSDLPADDGNQCTSAVCVSGVPSHPAVGAGSTCSQNGGAMCDGAGACVSCLAASDCPGSDTECSARTCTAGVCGVAFTQAGTAVAQQTAGDCQQNVCDGSGGIVSQAFDADLPNDGNQCTSDVCVNGVPSNPALTEGASCSQNGGALCDGMGACVQCVAATDCPGSDTECSMRTCISGVCGIGHAPEGQPLAAQTGGDCQQVVCDGEGGTYSAALDSDLPVDGNACTDDVCTAGVPSNPPKSAGETCGGEGTCDGTGACVECVTAADCPGSDTECSARTCFNGTCGMGHAPEGQPIAFQTAGDCQQMVCDGEGGTLGAVLDSDLPVDGIECTQDVCTDGVPSNPPVAAGGTCSQGGGSVCDGAGTCTQCVTTADCGGSDTECSARTCINGTCGVSHAPLGQPVAAQTAGDCRQNVCDGAGGTTEVQENGDVPGAMNQCSVGVCEEGVPGQGFAFAGTACAENGGAMCDGAGTCVECRFASDCPGEDTECSIRACNSGTCGTLPVSEGIVVSEQIAGDCRTMVCDGAGGIRAEPNTTDRPDDGNACTDDVCNGTTPAHPPVATGTACSQNGGAYCSATAACVECTENAHCASGSVCNASGACAATVLGVTPDNAATGVAVDTAVVVTFSQPVTPSTLTFNSADGACTGTVQVSADGFTNCVAIASVTMSNGDATATFDLAADLAQGQTYRVRVTTGVMGANGIPLAAQFSQVDGFATVAGYRPCPGKVVISQIYGGSGAASHDFVELHNMGGEAVNLVGWSLQYGSSGGTTWNGRVNLTGTIQPGGFYLVRFGSSSGPSIGTPDDFNNGIAIAAAAGKVALVSSTTALSGACPTGNVNLVDFVGFGSANCSLGGRAPAPSDANAVHRDVAGCLDNRDNATDFVAAPPAPRNSASPRAFCGCATDINLSESDEPEEADFCTIQAPAALSVARGAATVDIYGQIYEQGVTEAPGAPANLRAQIGYAKPGTSVMSPHWAWFEATHNASHVSNNDEYMGRITYAGMSTGTNAYSYVYRFSWDDGQSWTYCDADGAGSNPGLTFDLGQAGQMTVTP